MLDAIIVGGSSAGLSAALVLGRARRRVRVIDDGKPCNRFSHASHGFMTRDGVSPAELLRIAREQLAAYPNVALTSATVTRVSALSAGFSVETEEGEYQARKLLLASGLHDTLPALEGIEQFYGTSVFHCPYCDGWEVRDQPLVVLNSSETAFHQAMMLHQWSRDLTLCTGGEQNLTAEQREQLEKNGIRVSAIPPLRVEGAAGKVERLLLADGSVIPCSALFVRLVSTQRSPFAQDLGCKLTEQGLVQVDLFAETSVKGVYAAGDMANPMRSVAIAVAHGAAAAYGINHSLITEDF